MQKTILFVDNHAEFLSTWVEYLELADYRVYSANNPGEARKIILQGNIHLAIFDKRLVDDNNEDDNSGLELAKDPELGFIPSMILTDYPTHQNVREVLRPNESSAIDFINKKEDGPEGLLDAVARAFTMHIPIGWDLSLHWEPGSGLSIPGVLGMLEKNIPTVELNWRSEELEDLLRMVFYEFTEVTFIRIVWIYSGRVAVLTHGHHEQADRYFVVTIGSLAAIQPEIDHIKAFPDDPGEGGTTHVGFFRRAHYAANAWRLSGADIDQIELLQESAENLKENQLGAVLNKLFQSTLAAWRKQRDPKEHSGGVELVYRQHYPLLKLESAEEAFRERVGEIIRQAKRYNLVHDVVLAEKNWRFLITPRHLLTFPDPGWLLFHPTPLAGETICYTHYSPGDLRFNTILLGINQVTWLTNFAGVNELPIWHNFAFVECELRFSFLYPSNLIEIAEVEMQLRPSWPLLPRPGVDAPADMRKFVNCILRVREQAHNLIRQDPRHYALCLLFNALSEFLYTEPPIIRNRKDAGRLLHRLLLAGSVSSDLLGDRSFEVSLEFPPLTIDDAGMVRRGKELLKLSETEHRLLVLLYKHAGKPCDRGLICKEVFGIDHPSYAQLHGQIDANLNRLREKIEPEPKNPRYVITVHSRGIRLETHPPIE